MTNASMPCGLTLIITGKPRTKKNHGRIIRAGGHPRMIPSAAYMEWDALAQRQLAAFRASTDWKLPLRCNVNCAALFMRDAERGDAVGYFQALADTLQKGGILQDDKQIVSWDGSRILKDAAAPRVIVRLEPA